MDKVKVTQIRSLIDQPARQKRTIQALGLRKINHSIVHKHTPQIEGMIRSVSHLVKVEKA
jgi:large subunit ribosomal protein L30